MRVNRPRRPERQDGRTKRELAKWYEDGDEESDEGEEPRKGFGARVWRVLVTPRYVFGKPAPQEPASQKDSERASVGSFRFSVILRFFVWMAMIYEANRLNKLHQSMINDIPLAVSTGASAAFVFQMLFALVIAIALDSILRLPKAH